MLSYLVWRRESSPTDRRALRQTEDEQRDADRGDDADLASAAAQHGELVDERRDARLQQAELAVDAQREQHDEEQRRPERRQRHHRDAFRVRDERQARTCSTRHPPSPRRTTQPGRLDIFEGCTVLELT